MTKCHVCRHPRVLEANKLLTVGNVSCAKVGKELGLSEISVWRHRKKCLAVAMSKAVERVEAANGDRLLSFGQKCIDIADTSLGALVANKDHRTIPGMISAGMKAVETVARLECRPGFGDAVAPAAVVNIAMVRMPSMGDGGTPVTAVDATTPARLSAGVEIVDAEPCD